MIAYYRYTRARPDLHKGSKFKMPGGKIMALCIIIFCCVLFVKIQRQGVILLAIMYRQYKNMQSNNF